MGPALLADLLDRDAIEELAGSVFYERGLEYQKQGRVGPITESDDAIEATVSGERPYVVSLSVLLDQIAFDCTCPMGETGAFCKHCVALSLAWVDASLPHPAEAPKATRSRQEVRWDPASPDSVDIVRPFLEDLDRDALIDLVAEEMARDEELATHLHMRAAVASALPEGAGTMRRALDSATHFHDFLDYREVPTFAGNVGDVADAIEEMIAAGHSEVVIDLTERGLRRLEAAIEYADDSDGYIGDLLRRFEDIHLTACRVARPDTLALAQRLFTWELRGDYDVFHGAAARYADVLGQEGLAEYRRLAEVEWAKVPSRGPGDARRDHGDYRVTHIMESLARASGDVDEQVAVMSRDLSYAYHYLQIAELCRDQGRDDDALDWAEQGVHAFPKGTDVRLREFLAEEYLRRSRDDEAMALIWAQLLDQPGLEAYKRLKRYADRIEAWEAWRTRALEEVRRWIADAMAAPPPVGGEWQQRRQKRFDSYGPSDGTALVRILAWEGELDDAWLEARRLGCDRPALLELATQSAGSRPGDALKVYQDEVEAVLQTTDKRAYAAAVGLLKRIRKLMAGLERSDEFRTYAAAVRAANVRRPNFLAAFDSARLL